MADHRVLRDHRPAMDLHPGEEIVFEGPPSWRGLLSFRATAQAGAPYAARVPPTDARG